MVIGVKSISFTDEYQRELKYFEKQFNKSKYICELIREDVDRKSRNIDKKCRGDLDE